MSTALSSATGTPLARSRNLSPIPANEQAGGEPSVTGDRRTGPRSSRAR
jgi:hypothetical protein